MRTTSTRQAMTLVETLLSLALLSTVIVAGNAWVQVTTRASIGLTERSQWQASAEALLRLIHDQLAESEAAERANPRSRAEELAAEWDQAGQNLRIATRDLEAGRAIHTYQLSITQQAITASIANNSNDARRQSTAGPRGMLDHVAAFDCVVDEELRLLRVEIRSLDGFAAEREFRLP